MVDLTSTPFNLDDDAIAWVRNTIQAMTPEEKIGQLFVNMGAERTEEYLTSVLDNYHIGAVRYNPGTAEEVWEQNHILQTKSKIPLLIAANTEAGGNGACTDGTYVGFEAKIGATNDPAWAYEMGRVSGVEAAAIGCNWSFAPIVDIITNWRNPIVASRSWGNDADLVLEMSRAYMKGIMESGIMPAAKHWPGDGVDERDQHVSASVNSLSIEDWEATFGKVYRGLIEDGLPSIMAGHIMLPSYQRHFSPGTPDEELMPATLSKELMTDLLRGELGFNGLVVTDASHMVALTGAMARRDILPHAIAAGCDLFLFFNDPDEDMAWMMKGYENGIITPERLDEALTRILGLKARLGLHNTPREQILQPKDEAMAKIGLPENVKIAAKVSDKAVTLVKSRDPEVLPISAERFRKVLVVPVSGPDNPIANVMGGGADNHPANKVAAMLNERGYEATIQPSLRDKLNKLSMQDQAKAVMAIYSSKAPISELTDNYDMVLLVAKVDGMMQPVERVAWPATKGTADIPWYVHEIPTVFVSVKSPYALADVPQVRTYVNAYDDKDHTLEAVLDKLEGRSPFVGVTNVDAFCSTPDTRI